MSEDIYNVRNDIMIAFARPRWWQLRYRFKDWRGRRHTRNWCDVDEWLRR